MGEQPKDSTLAYFAHEDILPNPYNPRELFDREPMSTLRASIERVGVLVPLLVYRKKGSSKVTILDGERRWRCVGELIQESPAYAARFSKIPVNVVDEPPMVQNILTMFNIHNIREPWELMPTALKLQVIMDELQETSETKLATLTGLSAANVRRCKTLLDYPEKYRSMMLHLDKDARVKADFFIELHPVLNLITKNLPRYAGKDRDELIDAFLESYRRQDIKNVLTLRELADALRGAKKGLIPIREAEALVSRLLTKGTDAKRLIRETYHPARRTETIEKTVRKLSRDLDEFVIEMGADRDELLTSLRSLHAQLTAKLAELEAWSGED